MSVIKQDAIVFSKRLEMSSTRLAVQAIPAEIRPVCGASHYEQTEALLVGLQVLQLGAKQTRPSKGKQRPTSDQQQQRTASCQGAAVLATHLLSCNQGCTSRALQRTSSVRSLAGRAPWTRPPSCLRC